MGKSKAINKATNIKAAPEQDAVSEAQAQQAVRTLIRWAGDDPDRPGMADTPARVAGFYRDFFRGYRAKVSDYAQSIAPQTNYDDMIAVRDIHIASFCEHHLLPAQGFAHIAYIPGTHVAGIGALGRIASDCARRMSTQETIAERTIETITHAFAPRGAAVMISLSHGCMTLRDGSLKDTKIITTRFGGVFEEDRILQNQFIALTNKAS